MLKKLMHNYTTSVNSRIKVFFKWCKTVKMTFKIIFIYKIFTDVNLKADIYICVLFPFGLTCIVENVIGYLRRRKCVCL